jgi:ADP-heptose:LPS heptosyltransferase
MSESRMLEPSSRIGILWGGGLGDLLVLRVFLQAITKYLQVRPVFMTTAFHLPKIFQEFCEGVEVVILSRTPRRLLPLITEWRKHFDLLYLGPHPTLRTFILGRLLAPRRLWMRRHRERQPYLVEQLRADLSAFGLREPELDEIFANALPWKVHHERRPFGNGVPFLALHAGAKQGWQTTRWPLDNWRNLIRKILRNTDYSLCLLGIESEGEMLSSLLETLPRSLRDRVCLSLSQPLEDVAALIAASSGVICHNSGILHLATFLKTKTISVTGSSARYWRPCYPWVVNVTSGQCDLACNCYRCPVPCFHAKCIGGLRVERVWQAVADHLAISGYRR